MTEQRPATAGSPSTEGGPSNKEDPSKGGALPSAAVPSAAVPSAAVPAAASSGAAVSGAGVSMVGVRKREEERRYGWMRAHAEALGPLWHQATEFVRAFGEVGEGAPPRGVEGICCFADRMEALAADASIEGARFDALVDAAGSFLACLLIDHVGEGHHVEVTGKHRIRLGADGYFDPFAAVEDVLEDEQPRRALAERMTMAEREVLGVGPVSRVLRCFQETLDAYRPDWVVEKHIELQVFLRARRSVTSGMAAKSLGIDAKPGTAPGMKLPGERDRAREADSNASAPVVEVDLRGIELATRGESEDILTSAMARLVGMLPDTPEREEEKSGVWRRSDHEKGAEQRAALCKEAVPRLVAEHFLQGIAGRSGPGAAPHLVVSSVGGGVPMVFGVREGGRMRFVKQSELDELAMDVDELIRNAVQNLQDKSASLRISRQHWSEGSVCMVRHGDGLDASRVLLPEVWERCASMESVEVEEMVCAFPHRDMLLLAARRYGPVIEAMRRYASDQMLRAPHAITADLMSVRAWRADVKETGGVRGMVRLERWGHADSIPGSKPGDVPGSIPAR